MNSAWSIRLAARALIPIGHGGERCRSARRDHGIFAPREAFGSAIE